MPPLAVSMHYIVILQGLYALYSRPARTTGVAQQQKLINYLVRAIRFSFS